MASEKRELAAGEKLLAHDAMQLRPAFEHPQAFVAHVDEVLRPDRFAAHRFYHNQGLAIYSHHFARGL
jgi:hypothetical protein